MTKPKNVESLGMSFTDEPQVSDDGSVSAPKTEEQNNEELEKKVLGDNPEILEDNGKKVFAQNKETREMLFYDSNGKNVGLDVLDRLEVAYPKPPERLPTGEKKHGELITRFTKEQFNEEKNVTETVECPFEECENVSQRQNYADKDGNLVDAITLTIPKKFVSLVKLLRGEIGK